MMKTNPSRCTWCLNYYDFDDGDDDNNNHNDDVDDDDYDSPD